MISPSISFENWLHIVSTVFPKTPVEYFENHWYYDSATHKVFSISVENNSVSTLRIIQRQIYMNGDLVDVECLADVATLLDYRRKGYSTALLERNQSNNPAILFTSSAASLYSKHGYHAISRPMILFYPKQVDSNHIADIRDISLESLDDLAMLYDSFAPRFNGLMVRSPRYWQDWIKPRLRRYNAFVKGLWKGEKLVAYFIAQNRRVNGEFLVWVDEIVHNGNFSNAMVLLGGALVGSKVRVAEFLMQELSDLPIERVTDNSLMARNCAPLAYLDTDKF